MTGSERYAARYRDGYYVVIDTATGDVVPSDPGHYKRHRDGYLWDNAAASEARRLNDERRSTGSTVAAVKPDGSIVVIAETRRVNLDD